MADFSCLLLHGRPERWHLGLHTRKHACFKMLAASCEDENSQVLNSKRDLRLLLYKESSILKLCLSLPLHFTLYMQVASVLPSCSRGEGQLTHAS